MTDEPSKKVAGARLRPAVLVAVALASLAATGVALAQQPPAGPSAPPASPPVPISPQVPPPPAAGVAPVGPVGVWMDHTGRGAVEIVPCAEGLCGRIVWMQQPNDKAGRPLVDQLNENRRLQKRPICGLQVIGGLKQMRDGSWDGGWIYDPEQGERFDVELRMRAPDVLQVMGYKGLKFLSETFRWRRLAEAPKPVCPAPPA